MGRNSHKPLSCGLRRAGLKRSRRTEHHQSTCQDRRGFRPVSGLPDGLKRVEP
ncbi:MULTISPECIES: hypothetical protein [Streptomyces]|uniref:hypothetical protein n=1 Tax=Streptomyces TaxID=1883 RepID=UPI00292F3088|nr:hypothetical protein [Streptomyces sp. NEAU-HV9]